MRILCYGDSNTWGFRPFTGGRYPESHRWPAVLGRYLGEDYEVVEEGLNGRTIGNLMPGNFPLNGLRYLESFLLREKPFDVIIIYLGINDLFKQEGVSIEEIAANAGKAVDLVLFFYEENDLPIPRVILLSPLPANENAEGAHHFRELIEKSRRFPEEFRKVAESFGIDFIDTSRIISASDLDGVHIDGESHQRLGRHLADYIREQRR
ncbi:MAG: hypothetical protein DRP87_12850 [Spirochaetes bacterium]|nr:MAG: hypothetical protein DRP87_12850 [Spirochaetota bacterium]